jgi:hypothetical protein
MDDVMGTTGAFRIGDVHYVDYKNYFQRSRGNTGVLNRMVDLDSRGIKTAPTFEDVAHELQYIYNKR